MYTHYEIYVDICTQYKLCLEEKYVVLFSFIVQSNIYC